MTISYNCKTKATEVGTLVEWMLKRDKEETSPQDNVATYISEALSAQCIEYLQELFYQPSTDNCLALGKKLIAVLHDQAVKDSMFESMLEDKADEH